MGVDYTLEIEDVLRRHGLSNEGEIKYCINKITNAYRRVDPHCTDNFRLSVNGKRNAQYTKQRDRGCCGFYDEVISLKSSKVVKFGFNYGH